MPKNPGVDVIESRYEKDGRNRFVIDISTGSLEDLFNFFDRSAPFMRRDLDPELTDYLIDCARELGDRPFVIQFSLLQEVTEQYRDRITRSITTYFLYLAEKVQRDIASMLRKSSVFLLLGLTILSLAVWLSQWLGDSPSTVAEVFSQGLTVAAWVSLWESLAIFLVEWFPQRRERDLYKRLAACDLLFRTTDKIHGRVGTL